MEKIRLINLYGQGTDDFGSSPFEALETLQIRSELHKEILTREEQRMLAANDMKLLSNVEKMVEHVSKVYDFTTSTEPLDEWWWHLDMLLKGEIILSASPLQNKVI